MGHHETAKQLEDLSRSLLALEERGDGAAILSHLSDDFVITRGKGRELTKDAVEADPPGKGARPATDYHVEVSPDLALGVVTFVVTLKGTRYRNTQTFRRTAGPAGVSGGWVCARWQVTPLRGEAPRPRQSAEARWFFAGAVPPSVLSWFDAKVGAAATESREDRYLVTPGQDALGVKLREGKIEFKRREGEYRPLEIPGCGVGRIGIWRKWSFDVANEHASTAPATGQWLTVAKCRRTLKWSGNAGRVVPVATHLDGAGAAVEVTELWVGARRDPWWSLAFEAFADTDAELVPTLEAAGAQVLRDGPVCPRLDDAHDYPGWLSRIVGDSHLA